MLIWNDTCLPNKLEVTTNVQWQNMLKHDAGDVAHMVKEFLISLRSRWDHPTELLTRISQLHLQMTCTCRSMFTTAFSKPSPFFAAFLSRWRNSVRKVDSRPASIQIAVWPSMYTKASVRFFSAETQIRVFEPWSQLATGSLMDPSSKESTFGQKPPGRFRTPHIFLIVDRK